LFFKNHPKVAIHSSVLASKIMWLCSFIHNIVFAELHLRLKHTGSERLHKNSSLKMVHMALTLFKSAVLRIHDILGWIRIWIRGSMPLTNRSGLGSCYFRHWPSQDAIKKLIF
jgi:hypothetical protein